MFTWRTRKRGPDISSPWLAIRNLGRSAGKRKGRLKRGTEGDQSLWSKGETKEKSKRDLCDSRSDTFQVFFISNLNQLGSRIVNCNSTTAIRQTSRPPNGVQLALIQCNYSSFWIGYNKKLSNPNRCRKSGQSVPSCRKAMKLPKNQQQRGQFEEVFIENNGFHCRKEAVTLARRHQKSFQLKMQTERTVKRKLRIHSIRLFTLDDCFNSLLLLFAFSLFLRRATCFTQRLHQIRYHWISTESVVCPLIQLWQSHFADLVMMQLQAATYNGKNLRGKRTPWRPMKTHEDSS